MCWTGAEGLGGGIIVDEVLVVAMPEAGWEGETSDVESDSVVEKEVLALANGLTSTREVSKVISTVFGCVILVVIFLVVQLCIVWML
jgi:hypothetical protein